MFVPVYAGTLFPGGVTRDRLNPSPRLVTSLFTSPVLSLSISDSSMCEVHANILYGTISAIRLSLSFHFCLAHMHPMERMNGVNTPGNGVFE